MKYFKHMMDDRVLYFRPESDPNTSFPHDPMNMDCARMLEEVEAGEAEIVEVDDTPVPTWEDHRIAAYGSWREQLDMMYHGTWQDHVAAVKSAHPKP